MKRKIFCVISIVLILITSFIPASAEIYSYDSYWSSIYTGNSWPDLWWDSSVAIPRLPGETDEALSDVHLWIGLEHMSDRCTGDWVSDGVFQAIRAGIGDYGGYYVMNYDGGVFAYNPSAENGVVWNNVTNQYIMGDQDYYSSLGTPHYGVDGRFFQVDCSTEAMSEISNPGVVTYGLFFLGWIFDESASSNEDFGTTLCYSLYNNNGAFAVRWTGRSVETGEVTKFCYIGICAPQDRSGNMYPDAKAKLINLGKHAHPFSSGGGSNTGDLYDQIDQLQSTISQMESDHAAEIAALNSAHEEALISGRNESYHLGYNAGVEDSQSGISVDTSDPVNAVLGFFAVLFKGLRDFVMPILGVEISGVSILTLVGVLGLILFAGLIIAVIAKVRGG